MFNKTNKSIACTVESCTHHGKGENYCTLDKINVGAQVVNPSSCTCTECDSFCCGK